MNTSQYLTAGGVMWNQLRRRSCRWARVEEFGSSVVAGAAKRLLLQGNLGPTGYVILRGIRVS